MCINRTDGKIIWKKTIPWKGKPSRIHPLNSYASATCATDGEIVVASFGNAGLYAYSMDGELLWSKDLGKIDNIWGTAACPVIDGNRVIQNCDSDTDAYLIALNKKDGATIWKIKRPDHRGWSTPVFYLNGRRHEMLLNGHGRITSYDPETGKELWYCYGSPKGHRGTPAVVSGLNYLYIVEGRGITYCIKPGKQGDVSDENKVWQQPRFKQRDMPSPVFVDRYLFVVNIKGSVRCHDAKTGKILWQEEVCDGAVYASPVTANGYLYFNNIKGVTSVVKAGPEFELVSKNSVKDKANDKREEFYATISPSEGQLFIRSTQNLYCIGEQKKGR